MLQKQSYVKVLRVAVLLVGAIWTLGQAGAQSKMPMQKQTGRQITITDAAGRTHVRSVRPTYAQRRAAAKARVQALREAAAKRRLSEVKK